MPKLITLPVYENSTGKINVIEKILPFQIKRVYWIYDILENRGGHSHKVTIQAVVPIKGSCNILIKKKNFEKNFFLNKLFLYIKLSIKFIIYYKNFKII